MIYYILGYISGKYNLFEKFKKRVMALFIKKDVDKNVWNNCFRFKK